MARWCAVLALALALALGWEEEAAIAFILAYHPVVTAQRAVAVALARSAGAGARLGLCAGGIRRVQHSVRSGRHHHHRLADDGRDSGEHPASFAA